jgi:hypothetical protein
MFLAACRSSGLCSVEGVAAACKADRQTCGALVVEGRQFRRGQGQQDTTGTRLKQVHLHITNESSVQICIIGVGASARRMDCLCWKVMVSPATRQQACIWHEH